MVIGDRYAVYRGLYGEEGYSRIANAKILVVGAGGIGCEVRRDATSFSRAAAILT